jgi:hypothetical protein
VLPQAGSGVTEARRHEPVQEMGERPRPAAMPHQFSTGKRMRPVNISVDNHPGKFL